jgi:predicted ArsR family transcriptional regulator
MPGAERDDETGQFATAYPDSAAVEAITDAGGAATTQEVADSIGCRRETAYKKLVRLENEGRVRSRKVGNARLWTTAEADAETEATTA